MKVLILGRGRVGRGLAAAMRNADVEVALTSGRRPRGLASADVVLLTIPDAALGNVAASIAPRTRPGCVLLHCAGSLGPDALGDVSRPTGAMHPLVSFADPRRPPPLHGTTFAIDGSVAAKRAAQRIARACGARPLQAPALHGAAYHAAAALVANGAAALATVGVEILIERGLRRRSAERALAALLRTVADNVERVGVPAALTGPIMRGDVQTVRRHRQALRTEARRTYDALGPTIVAVARRLKSAPAPQLRAVRRLFDAQRRAT